MSEIPQQQEHTGESTQRVGEVNGWSFAQDKAFENALLMIPEGTEGRWEKMVALIPGEKTPKEIEEHYERLIHDIALIESDQVLPVNKSAPKRETKRTNNRGITIGQQSSVPPPDVLEQQQAIHPPNNLPQPHQKD